MFGDRWFLPHLAARSRFDHANFKCTCCLHLGSRCSVCIWTPVDLVVRLLKCEQTSLYHFNESTCEMCLWGWSLGSVGYVIRPCQFFGTSQRLSYICFYSPAHPALTDKCTMLLMASRVSTFCSSTHVSRDGARSPSSRLKTGGMVLVASLVAQVRPLTSGGGSPGRTGQEAPRVCIFSQRSACQPSGFGSTVRSHENKERKTCSLRHLLFLVGRVGSVSFHQGRAEVESSYISDRVSCYCS